MEPFRPPAYPAILGDLTYVGALALFVLLQRVALKLRSEERNAWWASNGRDLVNGFAVVTLSTAIYLQGIAPPLALLFGTTLTLLLSVIHSLSTRQGVPEPWRVVLLSAAILGSPLVIAPARAAEFGAGLLRTLF